MTDFHSTRLAEMSDPTKLRSLVLQHSEVFHKSTLGDMKTICEACPNLVELTVDRRLPFKKEDEAAEFEIPKSLRRLKVG